MENTMKAQMMLDGDRISARQWRTSGACCSHSLAYVLMDTIRRLALNG